MVEDTKGIYQTWKEGDDIIADSFDMDAYRVYS